MKKTELKELIKECLVEEQLYKNHNTSEPRRKAIEEVEGFISEVEEITNTVSELLNSIGSQRNERSQANVLKELKAGSKTFLGNISSVLYELDFYNRK